jgi:hypothetical protein
LEKLNQKFSHRTAGMQTTNFSKKTADPKPIQTVFKQPALQSIIQKSQWITQINQQLKNKVPEMANGECRFINTKDNTAILEVNHATQATQYRYSMDILATLQKIPSLSGIKRVIYQVRPQQRAAVAQKAITRQKISEKTKQMIQETADGIGSEELKAALMKLSQ